MSEPAGREHPPLPGRVVVVTGAASGIGLATVKRFAAAGARVAAWDVAESAGPGPSGWVSVVDVRDRAAVERAAARLAAETRRIDVLVNCAGVTLGYLDLEFITAAQWDRILDTNLRGALHCAQATVPFMKRRRWGRIVNVSSILARCGWPGQTAYAASKAALEAMTRTWARELGSFGITANAVSPGYIRTRMNERNDDALVRDVTARTPVGRLGEGDDVAAVIHFLCSDAASFVTGAVVPVDGGLVLERRGEG